MGTEKVTQVKFTDLLYHHDKFSGYRTTHFGVTLESLIDIFSFLNKLSI